jgi:sugar/nucleoside kinase (ribokinase family)
MNDVTVIGDVNVDLLSSSIPSYPREDKQILLSAINLQTGGGAANFAFAISKLGLKTRFIGMVGKDIFGDYLIREAKEFSIDSKIRQTRRGRTGITFGIHFLDGSRNLLTYKGANEAFSCKNFRMNEIEGKAIHIGGYNLLDKLRKDAYRIIKFAKNEKMFVSIDPDIKSGLRFSVEEFKRILKLVDVLFIDHDEGVILSGKKDKIQIVKELNKVGCKIVVLKYGKHGCVVCNRNKIFEIEGIKEKPINPTGTGDIFNAAFIFQFLRTRDVKKAAIFANASGALAITRVYEKRFPTVKEIEEFIRRNTKSVTERS